ncbi:MAG TPA: 4-hydroxy-tetrahydrodipicolinate synthase [Actinomyces sp.]|jgi:4-hydroxy-tetrahydrodipicolinate synthase|nr:4-hydroxy-tetrahydrodipicolinate synthase [Acidobacteriota bacterium]HHT41711.1 4-hydroxy-tetrahydrodipicolinate synthase [Actinomyces sp.]
MSSEVVSPIGQLSVAMVTPFKEDGSLDVDSAVKLARHLVDTGVDSVLVSGTTGEAPTTYQPEKDELTRAVIEEVGDEAYILAGAGSNDTAHAVRMAVSAEQCGADGLLVVSPYYNRPNQKGLRAHVEAIIEATTLPITLYDIPGRTGLAFSDETLDYLAQNDRIVAVKDATGNPNQALERMDRTGLAYYCGDDALNYLMMAGGASGIVSVVGHVAGPYFRKAIEAINDGRFAEARDIHRQMRPLIDAIMGGGQGAVMAKVAVHLQGVIDTDAVRLPLVQADSEDVERLRKIMEDLDLL